MCSSWAGGDWLDPAENDVPRVRTVSSPPGCFWDGALIPPLYGPELALR